MIRDAPVDFVPFAPRRLMPPSPADDVASIVPAASESAERHPALTAEIDEPSPPCDRHLCDARIRELAIRLAGTACARALGEAVARNPLFVARFVDDALRAAGDTGACRVRMHPEDARACAARLPCEIVADAAMSRGEIVVESDGASLGATLEQRAQVMVHASADV